MSWDDTVEKTSDEIFPAPVVPNQSAFPHLHNKYRIAKDY